MIFKEPDKSALLQLPKVNLECPIRFNEATFVPGGSECDAKKSTSVRGTGKMHQELQSCRLMAVAYR